MSYIKRMKYKTLSCRVQNLMTSRGAYQLIKIFEDTTRNSVAAVTARDVVWFRSDRSYTMTATSRINNVYRLTYIVRHLTCSPLSLNHRVMYIFEDICPEKVCNNWMMVTQGHDVFGDVLEPTYRWVFVSQHLQRLTCKKFCTVLYDSWGQ